MRTSTFNCLLFTTVMLLAAVMPVHAGDDPAVFTLDDCVRAALTNNHMLLSETEKLRAADSAVGMAFSGFLPKLTLSETYMRSDNPVMVFGSKLNQGRFAPADFAIAKLNDPDAIDNFNFRAELVQPLFNGGREILGYRRARLGRASAEKGLERTRQETVYRTVSAYYGVGLAREYVAVADKAAETTEAHVKTAQDFYDQGMLIGSEVLLAKVHLAEVREMRLKAVNGLSTAKAGLNLVMGRDQSAPLEVDGLPDCVHKPGELDGYIKTARESRPDLAGMELNVSNMEAGVSMARAGYLPNLNLVGRYDIDNKDMFGSGGESYTVMGMLSWNVFDGLYTTNSVSEARAGYNSISHMRDQMVQGAEFEVRRVYNDLVEASGRVETARAAVAEGEEALRIIVRRFDAGMTKTIDVLDAETALTRARTNLAQALYDAAVAMAGLELAAGTLDDGFASRVDVAD